MNQNSYHQEKSIVNTNDEIAFSEIMQFIVNETISRRGHQKKLDDQNLNLQIDKSLIKFFLVKDSFHFTRRLPALLPPMLRRHP